MRQIEEKKIKIFVQTQTGKILNFEVEACVTIANMKNKIANTQGIPSEIQNLAFEGTTLVDECTLLDYDIQEGLYFAVLKHFKITNNCN